MLKNMFTISVISALSIVTGILAIQPIVKVDSIPKSQNTTEGLEQLASQIDLLSTAIGYLRSDVLGLPQDVSDTAYFSSEQPEQADTSAIGGKIVDTSIQVPKAEENVVLTPAQQGTFDDLALRIESAQYGAFTMDELSSEMDGMPKEYQTRLLEQVVKLVNNGNLDPQRFVEGSN